MRTTTSTVMKILMSSQKPSPDLGKRALEGGVQSKKVALTFDQPLLVRISAASAPRTTTVETLTIAAPGRRGGGRLAHGAAVRVQRSSGPLRRRPSTVLVISSSWPLDSSLSSAWSAHGVSVEPFANSRPNESPPGALNWPTIFDPGTWAAVREPA